MRTLAMGTLLLLGAHGAVAGTEPAPPAPPDGKAVFLAQGCITCHGVKSAGLEAKVKAEAVRGSDLTNVTRRHERAWLRRFLTLDAGKQLDGRKHPKKLTGPAAEVEALLDWLEKQVVTEPAPPAAPAPAPPPRSP